MMRRLHTWLLSSSLVVLGTAALAHAESRAPACFQVPEPTLSDFEGTWFGTLKVGIRELRLSFEISMEDGELVAEWNSHDQGALGLTINRIEVDGREIELTMRSAGATFTGTLSENGDRLVGTFEQHLSFPLELDRVEEVPAPARPQTPQEPFPYRQIDVRFHHSEDEGAGLLAGTLTVPEGDGPFPAAILISGSGPQDRDETLLDHKPFWVLADHLSRRGIAVLRYDDRGVAESDGDFDSATTFEFANDAASAVRFLVRHPLIDHHSIGLIGHSEGGLIAPIVAKKFRDLEGEKTGHKPIRLAYCVLIAGPAVDGREVLRVQQRLQLSAMGAEADEIARAQELQAKLLSALLDSEGKDPSATVELAAVEAWKDMTEDDKGLFGAAVEEEFVEQITATLGSEWMKTFLVLDPAEYLQSLRCPTLAIFGEKDVQVPPSQSAGPMREYLAATGVDLSKVVVFRELNHLMQHCGTGSVEEYARIEETLAPEVLSEIGEFVRAVTKRQND